MDTRAEYRNQVNEMGKKEFTFLKMQEYGFWPAHLPTPYERQQNETEEDFKERTRLLAEFQKLSEQIAGACQGRQEIEKKLVSLRKEYEETWDYEKVRAVVSQEIMKESIARRAQRKEERERLKQEKTEAWKKRKAESILFIGKGYSGLLGKKETDLQKLKAQQMPVVETDRELADLLEVDYKTLRFLAYHRDVVTFDNYYRFEIPKKDGRMRQIAAPKTQLKTAQRAVLDQILQKAEVSEQSHGFLKSRSVLTSAKSHEAGPELLINMDLENFFPTITFERVRGLFQSFGYSGYIASLLAMICTYCERMPLEIKGETKYVKTTDRILPQGSPASPMITNIICRRLDQRLQGLSQKLGLTYTRYADDMSFSYTGEAQQFAIGSFLSSVRKIVEDEGFCIKEQKTHVLRKSNRQYITGIVINNEEIGVPRKWVKVLKASIHNARKLYETGGCVTNQTRNEIAGKIAWLRSVNEERYQKLIRQGTELLNDLDRS
ncbi:MAG: RNA-directed DNA polymerase [Lachnospiraceae bacterium]|nr:RNA-directed DNA polymerase [Lachnospiraceae bacterium]